MTGDQQEERPYVQVWGDAVHPRHLWPAVLIGVVLGLGGLLVGEWVFAGASPELREGYALLTGLAGCLVAAVVSAKLFPPKRVVREQALSPEEHRAAIAEITAADGVGGALSPHAARELRSVGLHDAFERAQQDREVRP
ncbi:hypothetical protein [Saccharopolyspora hordei]|uniref:Uncharacterized protein n=1 Tax=Saccharopolyspora hordei TaxID=1838 RepID=A0A853AP87_9PSEU|nr:hypothetical protein [Saccharopolyspora hordei]NYI84243.1 hypothetical protein [Saccharopolyspora hordei]